MSVPEGGNPKTTRAFVRGDIDGFFGLAVDNLVQILLIDALCRHVIGMSSDLLYGRILPGVVVSLIVGNGFYAWQARRLARAEQRDNVCALPYGINTVSLFAYVFLVMLPAKLAAERVGAPDPARVAWQAGLLACLGSALIEIAGAGIAERIRRATPRAALLSTLAGIALGFISLAFLFRTFAHPLVGMVPFGVVLLTYFGQRRFKGGLPGGFIAVLCGTALAWATGLAPTANVPSGAGLSLPLPVPADLATAFSEGHLARYASVIVPMGVFNVIGSLQNLESAEAAGDRYPAGPSLAMNGLGSLAAAFFGSCFPTTIYIGHPGWKAMGARAGYSVLNAVFFAVVITLGWLGPFAWAVPVEAGMAIVLWIGIVITAQAFQTTPRSHAPAVVIGVLPGVAAWGALMAKNGLRAAGYGAPGGPSFDEGLVAAFERSDTWIEGAFALEQGFIFTAMILSAATVSLIEQRFVTAGLWCLGAALLSAAGIMHAYAFTHGDTVQSLEPAWPWAVGYTLLAVVFLVARLATEPVDAALSDGPAEADDPPPD